MFEGDKITVGKNDGGKSQGNECLKQSLRERIGKKEWTQWEEEEKEKRWKEIRGVEKRKKRRDGEDYSDSFANRNFKA